MAGIGAAGVWRPKERTRAPSNLKGTESDSRKVAGKVKKIAIRGAVVFVVLLIVALITDNVIAARAEHKISEALYADSNLANPPKVQVAGFPYTRAALSHEIQAVTVTASDVDVPGFGLMSVHTSAQYITVSADDVFNGKIENAPARKVFTRLQLDGVLLGDRMNIEALQIQNLDDISPRGGWETEAVFEGKPEGFAKPAKVEVKLRIVAGTMKITPIKILSAPDGLDIKAKDVTDEGSIDKDIVRRINEAFSLSIPGKQLPMPGDPERVYVSGGSLFVETEQVYTKISLSDLAPRSRPLSEEEQPRL